MAETRNSYDDNQGSNSAVLKLDAGDEVWTSYFHTGSGELFGDTEARGTSFMGVLLYEVEP